MKSVREDEGRERGEIAALAKKEDAEANQGDMEVLDALFDAASTTRIGTRTAPTPPAT